MIASDLKYTETVEMITIKCCNCGVVFGMPSDLQRAMKADKDRYFYCPNGHSQHYAKSTADELKEKLATEKIRNENEQNRIWDMVIEERNEKDKLKKQLKRVHKGVCPCCNRTFENLQRHISTKHPELVKPLIQPK